MSRLSNPHALRYCTYPCTKYCARPCTEETSSNCALLCAAANESDSEEDEDDLGLPSFERLTAGIQHAIRAIATAAHAAASDSEADDEEGPDDPSSSSSGDEEEEEDEKAGGKAAAAAGDVPPAAAAVRGKSLLHWRPEVVLPKQRESTRLVHQRGPEKVEKEAGLTKEVSGSRASAVRTRVSSHQDCTCITAVCNQPNQLHQGALVLDPVNM